MLLYELPQIILKELRLLVHAVSVVATGKDEDPCLMGIGGFKQIQLFLNPLHGSSDVGDFPIAQTVKNLPAKQETWVQSLGWEDLLEKGKATHSSILAWRSPWTV